MLVVQVKHVTEQKMTFCIKSIVISLVFISKVLLLRSFGKLIYDYAQKYEEHLGVNDFRKYERLRIKIKKAELDIIFLNNCQTFQVFPRFVCIKLPHANTRDTLVIRKRLLKAAINKRNKEKCKLLDDFNQHETFIKKVINSVNFYLLNKVVTKNVNQEVLNMAEYHENKLQQLTLNHSLPFGTSETINNLSAYELTSEEESILLNGLSFSIPPSKLSKSDIFTSFEMINFM